MKQLLLLFAFLVWFALPVAGQNLEKPTLTGKPPTAAQLDLIHQGTALHDAGKFAEAIAKYEQVLQENPDCTQAMYELALSLKKLPNLARAEAVARRGTKYKSDDLPLFYLSIANEMDDEGRSDEAIQIFKTAINILKSDNDLHKYLARIDFNLAVTYLRRKQYAEMRPLLKEALGSDFAHPSSNYMLAVWYSGAGYKIPALLAAARFLSLEQNTDRSRTAAKIFLEVLKPAPKNPATGNMTITLDPNARKDEGDFEIYDLFLGTATIALDEKDKNKSPNELFVNGVNTIIALLAEDKKLRAFFVGQTYVPYMNAMKTAGHADTFAYLVLQQNGDADAAKWISANPEKLKTFLAWAQAYRPAGA